MDARGYMELYEWGWAETTGCLHKRRQLPLRDVELVILEQSIQRTTVGTKRRVGYKGSGQIEIIRHSSRIQMKINIGYNLQAQHYSILITPSIPEMAARTLALQLSARTCNADHLGSMEMSALNLEQGSTRSMGSFSVRGQTPLTCTLQCPWKHNLSTDGVHQHYLPSFSGRDGDTPSRT